MSVVTQIKNIEAGLYAFCNGCIYNTLGRQKDGRFAWGCEKDFTNCDQKSHPFVTLVMFAYNSFEELDEYNNRMVKG